MSYVLDDSPGYMYLKMADHITRRIKDGELPYHALLPSEQRLAYEYGVSLGTARHATRVLRERKLVFTMRAKGTYIGLSPGEQEGSADEFRSAPWLDRKEEAGAGVKSAFYQVSAEAGRWNVVRENELVSNHNQKPEAVREAMRLARANRPCELEILNRDGSVQGRRIYRRNS